MFARQFKFTGVAADALILPRDDGKSVLQRVEVRLDVLLVGLGLVEDFHAAETEAGADRVHLILGHAGPLDLFLDDPFTVALPAGDFVRLPDGLLKFNEGRHAAERQAHLVKRPQDVGGRVALAQPRDEFHALPDLVLRPERVESLA